MLADQPLLEVRGLVKHFPTRRGSGTVSAVEDVSFTVRQGENLGLVGESGSGKTTTAMTALRLQEPTAGAVLFRGQDVFGLSGGELRRFRRNAQFVFQDPYSSLNPRMRVRDLVAEPLDVQRVGDRAQRRERVGELLELVGLRRQYADLYPHQFSGGQRQRIGVARALALEPALLVCDEPVSALDVSVQAQILNLFTRLQRELGLTYLFISHDLAVIKHVSNRVAVMYLGRVVEVGPKDRIFDAPRHPYTRALLSAAPAEQPDHARTRIILTGEIPSAADPPSGCRFHPRCPIAQPICAEERPLLHTVHSGHSAACHFAEESPERMQSVLARA